MPEDAEKHSKTSQIPENVQNDQSVRFFSSHLQAKAITLQRRLPPRHGCRHGGARDVKAHRWFNGFDFDALLARELPPPYIPPVRSALDTSCFDEYELPEEDLLFLDHEDSPRVAAASTPAQRRDSCDSFKSVASDAPDDWAATF